MWRAGLMLWRAGWAYVRESGGICVRERAYMTRAGASRAHVREIFEANWKKMIFFSKDFERHLKMLKKNL